MTHHRAAPARWPRVPGFGAVALSAALAGCASTTVDISGNVTQPPLCAAPGARLSALVLWGPRWRADQKDAADRERAAQRGIDRFFAESGCYDKATVVRRIDGQEAIDAPAIDVLGVAALDPAQPTRVLTLVLRELGPVLRIGTPAGIEGGTEVVLEISARDIGQAAALAEFTARWQHGGPGVIKGVGSLEDDLVAALRAALAPRAAAETATATGRPQ